MGTCREIFEVLVLFTDTQRERLLYTLYELSYEEVGKIYSCSKSAMRDSIKAVRKIFLNFFKNHPHD